MIQLPQTYSEGSARTYPVLYALDAELFFGMQVQLPFALRHARELPEFIIVGPAYGASSMDKILGVRRRDYTPTSVSGLDSGGGPDFLAFLKTDLVPFIDAELRTQPKDRTLWGYSFGGLFALYVLFTEPELFQRYIATSPSVWWDDEIIMDIEEAYALRRPDLPAHLFTSLGSLESEDDFQRPWTELTDRLRRRGYDRFELDAVQLKGHTHFSVPGPSFVAGLRARPDYAPRKDARGL